MPNPKKNRGSSSVKKNTHSKLERNELLDLSRDEAINTVLPCAKDTVPYAKNDLSVSLTKTLRSWDSRGSAVCMFKENISLAPLSQQALAPSYRSYSFTLGALGNQSSITTLFDQYRITAVVVTATPTVTGNFSSPSSVYLPRLYSVIDYDDDINPATINVMQQYATCVVAPTCTPITRVFQPRIAMAAYGSASFTSYASVGKQWIDAASPNVNHYGIKFGIEGGASGQTILQIYQIEAVVFYECRNQR